LNSLKCFRYFPWCGSPESMCYHSTELHHTFCISLKPFWWHPWPWLTRVINFNISYGKVMTSHCSQ